MPANPLPRNINELLSFDNHRYRTPTFFKFILQEFFLLNR